MKKLIFTLLSLTLSASAWALQNPTEDQQAAIRHHRDVIGPIVVCRATRINTNGSETLLAENVLSFEEYAPGQMNDEMRIITSSGLDGRLKVLRHNYEQVQLTLEFAKMTFNEVKSDMQSSNDSKELDLRDLSATTKEILMARIDQYKLSCRASIGYDMEND